MSAAKPLCLILHGHARAGKDTAAQHLVEAHGFRTDSYVRTMKRAMVLIFNIPLSDFYDETRKSQLCDPPWDDVTNRALQQLFGTEACRKVIHPDIWVRSLVGHARTAYNNGDLRPLVITDARFPNEIDVARQQLSGMYHVVTVKLQRHVGPLVGGIPGHESEAHDLPCDTTIQNTGTLEDLATDLDLLLASAICRQD